MAVNLSPVGGAAAQFFDNNGVILSGGKLYTYAAGTTTPQATFTSSSGGTAHTNPIILDSAGRVPSGEIWLTNNLVYKFLLRNASDVLIGTYDNISGISSITLPVASSNVTYTPAGSTAVARTAQSKMRDTVSVKDFGAVGNGVTDESTAIQNALNYIYSLYAVTDTFQGNARSFILYFPEGQYVINNQILLLGNIVLQGSAATILSTLNISTPVFQTAYLNSGVLTPNNALTDAQSISNRLVGLRFENLTFYNISNCINLRSANEQSGIFNCRFNECDIAWTAKQCFYSNYVDNFVRDYKSDNTQFAVTFLRATNRVSINALTIAERSKGMTLGETTLANFSSSIELSNSSFETMDSAIRLVGNIYNFTSQNNYFEQVSNVHYDEDGELKYNIYIANNYSYSTAKYVDLSGLRDSFIGQIIDAAIPATKAEVDLRIGAFGNQCNVELSSTNEASTGVGRYFLSNGVVTNGVLAVSPNTINTIPSNKFQVSNVTLSQFANLTPIYETGFYGLPAVGAVFGSQTGVVTPTAGVEVYVVTKFYWSEYTSVNYALLITPNAGSGPGGTTPAPVYLKGIVIGSDGTQIVSNGHGVYGDEDIGITECLIIHFDNFGSSPTDPAYAWMRNNQFTSQGIIKLIA